MERTSEGGPVWIEDGDNNNTVGKVALDEDDEGCGGIQGASMLLETSEERRRRRYSLWIIYFTTFIQSLGFSIVLAGVWPYLLQLEKEPNKEMLGWVIAANPIGQLIFSPLIGWLCTRLGSIRLPSVACLVVFVLSNLWYALLPLHASRAQYFMILARFFVGVSSGSITACKTFVTQETLLSERTPTIAILSLFQGVGFMCGPAVQVLLTGLGEDGIQMGGRLSLSMYTGPGWIAAFFGIINVVLYHPKLFTESDIAAKEFAAKQNGLDTGLLFQPQKQEVNWSKLKPDYVAISVIVVSFFVMLFNFSLLEALGTPVLMDQLSWSRKQAVRNFGIAMTCSSSLSILLFSSLGPLSRRFDERKLLIFLGIFPMLIGRVFFFPFPGPVAQLERFGCFLQPDLSEGSYDNSTVSFDEAVCKERGLEWTEVQYGCPAQMEWCFQLPALHPYMILVGFIFGTIGYPFCVTIPQTLYSKVLGPRPQGTWNGGLTAVVSLAKIIGAVLLIKIYVSFGTAATSGLATGLLLLALALILIFRKRLVPFTAPDS